jgi:hypothetical protein
LPIGNSTYVVSEDYGMTAIAIKYKWSKTKFGLRMLPTNGHWNQMKLQMPNAQHALKRKKGFCGFLIIITIFVIRKRTSSSAFYSLPSFSAKPLAVTIL